LTGAGTVAGTRARGRGLELTGARAGALALKIGRGALTLEVAFGLAHGGDFGRHGAGAFARCLDRAGVGGDVTIGGGRNRNFETGFTLRRLVADRQVALDVGRDLGGDTRRDGRSRVSQAHTGHVEVERTGDAVDLGANRGLHVGGRITKAQHGAEKGVDRRDAGDARVTFDDAGGGAHEAALCGEVPDRAV